MTDQSVREGSSGTPGAAPAGATIMPPADPSAPLLPQASGKPAGTRLGFSNYLGLAGALLVMIVLFSLLSSHFLTYDTFSSIANQIPDLVVMSVGMTFVLIIAGIDLSVGSLLAPGGSPAFLIVVAVVLDTYRSRRKRAMMAAPIAGTFAYQEQLQREVR
jgi:ribose transport system permease protein